VRENKTGSFKVGSVSGIPINIHITFILLLAYLIFGGRGQTALIDTIFILLVFGCVLIHELAHALVAKRFGIRTKKITLYPIGGLASIAETPEARQEVLISLAGPIANLLIAALIYLTMGLPELNIFTDIFSHGMGTRLFLTNIWLALFNMIPALPMDGGRVLRASLNILGVHAVTNITTGIGIFVSVLFAIGGVYSGEVMLFLMSFVVFVSSVQEFFQAEGRIIATSLKVRDAMVPKERVESFLHGTTVAAAISRSLTSWQPFFPVTTGNSVIGVVSRTTISDQAAINKDEYLSEFMTRDFVLLEADAPLKDALDSGAANELPIAIVVHNGEYVGVLAYDIVTDLLIVEEMRRKISQEEREREARNDNEGEDPTAL
jgi:Zn-dependent protease